MTLVVSVDVLSQSWYDNDFDNDCSYEDFDNDDCDDYIYDGTNWRWNLLSIKSTFNLPTLYTILIYFDVQS